MKKEDLQLEMLVSADNCFGAVYFVVKINKTTVWLENRTGNLIMRRGKFVPEVFLYKNIPISKLKKA